MTMQKTVMLVALAGLLALPGCRIFRGLSGSDSGDDTWSGYDSYGSSAQSITWDSLGGQLGGQTIDLNSVEGSAIAGSYEIDTTVSGEWTMFRLDIYQSLDEIPDNTILTSYNGDVELLGCVGPTPGNYDYDGYATDLTVTVSQGSTAEMRQVDFVATFQDDYGQQTVQGSFVVDTTAGDGETGLTVPDP